jgi:hypothetical protein
MPSDTQPITSAGPDPLSVVRGLDSATIRDRIRSLEAERAAWQVILRSAVARERVLARGRGVQRAE